ncbi:type II toxin-antitoxin system HicA family toxin [Rhodocaloribacter sp.]
MTKLPRLTGKEVIRASRKAGYEGVRVKGSRHFLRHEDGRTTVQRWSQ